jgi:alpha-1,6-mannosyltransferase
MRHTTCKIPNDFLNASSQKEGAFFLKKCFVFKFKVVPKTFLNLFRRSKLWPIWFVVAILAYLIVGYGIDRSQFSLIVTSWLLAFAAYFFLCRQNLPVNKIVVLAVILRLVFLMSIPVLSDDFYRFIWDGQLIIHGLSPYSSIPMEVSAEVQRVIDADGVLLKNMNSTEFYSVYPPLHQLVFAISAAAGHSLLQSVIVMRVIILLFEIAVMWLLIKLLLQLQMQSKSVALYAFNPLVIIEASGNLHLESIMMTFFIAGMLLLLKEKHYLAGVGLGTSFLVKLSSAIYLPLLLKSRPLKQGWLWLISAIAVVLVAFLIAFSVGDIMNALQSVDLYFRKFEFNASVYYLLRELGIYFSGYNMIQYVGPFLSFISLILIFVLSLSKTPQNHNGIFKRMCWIALIYLLFSTTIHPWYLIPLLVLMIPAGLKFPIIWSLAIVASYSAYAHDPYQENYFLIAGEYLLLMFTIWMEWRTPGLLNSFFAVNADETPK